ncbi:hypothetical protein [Bacillus paramobilis]|uniref:hypothetical protein n=1 Tax=Bacillus paramobilis TaxID=2817477 RepID=UPI001BB31634|nr:hypothetical protein [Bacillus paramobilis]HEF5065795.1 hypothetical protein [Bacillus cereus]HEF5237779.1 hypothetical protein [Bacillus cereus]
MINKLEVTKVEHKVEIGSVIHTQSEGGNTKYAYIVVDDSNAKVRLIDLERGYLFSHALDLNEVLAHVEGMWDEKVLRVFKKDEIQLSEVK